MGNKVKYCSFVKGPQGEKCGAPHTESGVYCVPCRRQYQKEWRAGLRGNATREQADCEYCGHTLEGRIRKVAGQPACQACEITITHLASAPLPVYDLILEGVQRIHDKNYDEEASYQPKRVEEPTLAEKLGVTDDDPITLALLNGHGLGPAPAEPESEFEFDDTPLTPEEKAAFDAEWREGVEALNAFAKKRAKDQ